MELTTEQVQMEINTERAKAEQTLANLPAKEAMLKTAQDKVEAMQITEQSMQKDTEPIQIKPE